MSTNINISVGDNKLLDQARLQQNASRQAQLEKEANKRLSNEAEINRVNALAAQGKDANGNTITAPGTAPKPLRDEPAATQRDLGSGFVLVPNATYGEYGYTAKTKDIANKNFTSRRYGFDGYSDLPYPNFSVNEGPGNAPALLFNPQTNYFLEYVVCNNLNVKGYDLFNRLVDTTSGMQQPIEISQPLHETTEYTLELFVRANNSENPSFQLDLQFLYYDDNPPPGSDGRYWLAYILFQVSGGVWVFRAFAKSGSGTTPDGIILPIPATAWHHIAVVRKNSVYTCYFNGQQYFTGSLASNIPGAPTPPALTANFLDYANSNSKIHGIRFSRKALYSGTSFTPPTNITKLA